ncbi:kinase-like domain-containing protein [Gilbertella persicaria]|uniref:kinase-like domain-containing protein n=1 Tax=Gilbertella persicaria TaxID=101096 RepID=UPI00221F2958|nr:kinase-like domain-containing protein [Gilbertella persicaria]KAI8075467.1 kinase-like domain-containing protein [Gilbertella persicaria]
MAFINYLARHTNQQENSSKHVNKRSQTLPIVSKKKKEIGDYILCKTIGRGASGRVKLGIHKQTGEKVAIKMISRSQLTVSSTTARSVQRELAVLQLLHHPHLVDLCQVLQDSSYVYFVMEYLEGGELFHMLATQGRLPESEARRLFAQLISALHWCHAHHISHRDLKPENILLDKSKNLKIVDFGMAVMQPPNTLLRTSCGSPHYASPEIVRGKRYDGTATDVWSCGAIMYAMVTGHLPFDDEHMGRLLAKIKTGRYRSLPDYLSADARDLIKRMLVVDPTKRMTMAEILDHPWLTNKSFLGTELRFLHQPYSRHDPLQDPELLDGRIWETLKVLWREKTEEELLNSLSTYGCNVQKLTCKLLQERSKRLKQQQTPENHSSFSLPLRRSSVVADDVLMTPPLRSLRHGNEDLDSYILSSTPYESSVDTMSCCRTLDMPLTPKSTTTFQQLSSSSSSTVMVPDKKKNNDSYSILSPIMHQRPMSSFSSSSPRHWVPDDGVLAQTEETRGSKSAADVFIMTKNIETTFAMHDEKTTRSTWWLCSKDDSQQQQQQQQETWWTKTCGYFKRKIPEKTIAIECFAKHEYETAGKLHQVLEECFHGKLTGRMYPHGKVVWSGLMNIDSSPLTFVCHMTKIHQTEKPRIRVHFILGQGDLYRLESSIQSLLDCLKTYEKESDWVTKTNGWIQPEIIL